MSGPGTELKKIIPSVLQHKGCGCSDYAKQMDKWGPDGCEQRKAAIVARLMSKARGTPLVKKMPVAVLKKTAEHWVRVAIARSRK